MTLHLTGRHDVLRDTTFLAAGPQVNAVVLRLRQLLLHRFQYGKAKCSFKSGRFRIRIRRTISRVGSSAFVFLPTVAVSSRPVRMQSFASGIWKRPNQSARWTDSSTPSEQ